MSDFEKRRIESEEFQKSLNEFMMKNLERDSRAIALSKCLFLLAYAARLVRSKVLVTEEQIFDWMRASMKNVPRRATSNDPSHPTIRYFDLTRLQTAIEKQEKDS